jgi:hypothetical protein
MYCDTLPIRRGLERYEKAVKTAIRDTLKETAKEMQSYARENAPWKDRTGNARRGLTGSWGVNQYVYYVKLAHSVEYGVYLELSNEKRFEIIAPTIQKFEPSLYDRIKEKIGT